MAKKTVTKKRKVLVEAIGEAHIHASFNNIIVSLTNKRGDVISWSSYYLFCSTSCTSFHQTIIMMI